MHKLFLATVSVTLALTSIAEARHHRNRSAVEWHVPPAGPSWGKAVPCGAYETTVTYRPNGQRCIGRLVQSASGWWIPERRCELTGAR